MFPGLHFTRLLINSRPSLSLWRSNNSAFRVISSPSWPNCPLRTHLLIFSSSFFILFSNLLRKVYNYNYNWQTKVRLTNRSLGGWGRDDWKPRPSKLVIGQTRRSSLIGLVCRQKADGHVHPFGAAFNDHWPFWEIEKMCSYHSRKWVITIFHIIFHFKFLSDRFLREKK